MKIHLFLLILVDYFRIGMTLHCYQCNSETHRRCISEDLLIDKFLVECPPAQYNYSGQKTRPYCSKINQWLYFTKKKRTAVIRGCNYYHKYKDKCEVVSDRDSYLSVCFCHREGCNSSIRRRSSLGFLVSLWSLWLIAAGVTLFPT